MGFRAGADLDALDHYLLQVLDFKDEMARKRLLYELPAALADVDDQTRAVTIRSALEARGARVQLKAIKLAAPTPEIIVQREEPIAEVREQPLRGLRPPQEETPAAPPDYRRPSEGTQSRLDMKPVFSGGLERRWDFSGYLIKVLALFVTAAVGGALIYEFIAVSRIKTSSNEQNKTPQSVAYPGGAVARAKATEEIKIKLIQPAVTVSVPTGASSELTDAIELLKKGEITDALARLEKYYADHPGDRDAAGALSSALTSYAQQLLQNGDTEGAIDRLNKANEITPDNPMVIGQLGSAYYTKKDYDKALSYLNEALRLGSADPGVHLLLGLIYYYFRDDLEQAESHLNKAIEGRPDRQDLVALRDKIHRERGVEEKMDAATAPHFIVKYEGIEDRNAGYTVLYELERAYSSIGYDLGQYPPDPLTVILYTQQQFQEITRTPHWAGGLFDGRIRLPVGGLPNKNDDNLRRLLFHEYTHAVVRRITDGNCPIWLNEGLAEIMQERSGASRDPWIKIEELKREQIPTLTSLTQPFLNLDQNSAKIAYVESYYATQFLIQSYGLGGVRQLLQELGKGTEWKQAFQKTFGTEFSTFEERFYTYLKTTIE